MGVWHVIPHMPHTCPPGLQAGQTKEVPLNTENRLYYGPPNSLTPLSVNSHTPSTEQTCTACSSRHNFQLALFLTSAVALRCHASEGSIQAYAHHGGVMTEVWLLLIFLLDLLEAGMPSGNIKARATCRAATVLTRASSITMTPKATVKASRRLSYILSAYVHSATTSEPPPPPRPAPTTRSGVIRRQPYYTLPECWKQGGLGAAVVQGYGAPSHKGAVWTPDRATLMLMAGLTEAP